MTFLFTAYRIQMVQILEQKRREHKRLVEDYTQIQGHSKSLLSPSYPPFLPKDSPFECIGAIRSARIQRKK